MTDRIGLKVACMAIVLCMVTVPFGMRSVLGMVTGSRLVILGNTTSRSVAWVSPVSIV